MKRIIISALITGAILSHLSSATANEPSKDTPSARAYWKEVKAKVLNELRDPDSAKFKCGFAYPDERAAAGLVNAKNAFGGYTGYQTFVLIEGEVHIVPIITEKFCEKHTYN